MKLASFLFDVRSTRNNRRKQDKTRSAGIYFCSSENIDYFPYWRPIAFWIPRVPSRRGRQRWTWVQHLFLTLHTHARPVTPGGNRNMRRRHRRTGSVWGCRTKRCLIDPCLPLLCRESMINQTVIFGEATSGHIRYFTLQADRCIKVVVEINRKSKCCCCCCCLGCGSLLTALNRVWW